jgi:hypothetical protein
MSTIRYHAHWTPDEDAALRELAECGYTRAEAAAELGVTEGQVTNRCQRAGIRFRHPAHRYDAEVRARVIWFIAAGARQKEIAEAIGKPIEAVCKLVAEFVRNGLVRREGSKRSLRMFVTPKWYSEASE